MECIIIDANEIAILIRRDISTAQKLLRTLKDSLGKKKHQPVTIKEFCDYMDFPFDEISNMINKAVPVPQATQLSKGLTVGRLTDDKKSA